MKATVAAALLLGMAGVARADAPNLIVNGGFETGNFSGFNTSNINFTNVITGNSQSGNYSAALGNVGSNGIISQTFSDVSGTPLLISFYYQADGATPSNFSASYNNVPFFTTTNTPTTAGYVQVTSNVTATGADTLSFSERNDPGFFFLDSVSVTPSGSSSSSGSAPSPEVNTLLGFLVVGGTVAFLKRRRRDDETEGAAAA